MFIDPKAEEMREAILTMILNRIDELDARLDNIENEDWPTSMARKQEAKYIIATCFDRFKPREPRS